MGEPISTELREEEEGEGRPQENPIINRGLYKDTSAEKEYKQSAPDGPRQKREE
jgi:hypothetical protein